MISKFKIVYIAIIIAVALFNFSACTMDESTEFVFGTTFSVEFDGSHQKLKKQMIDTLIDMESVFSTQVEGSDIYRINAATAGEAVEVSEQTMALLKLSKDLYQKSGGAYNPAVYPLVELWEFSPDTYTGIEQTFDIPSASEISATLLLCDFDLVTLDNINNIVTKSESKIMLDLGAIAKGYAVGELYAMAENKDVSALINLGGNIAVVGEYSYNIGIAHPRAKDSKYGYFAKISLKNAFISTSGDYERYYIKDDIRYCHIIGKDGYPANSGVISCSIIGDNASLCDAVATAVVVLGSENGIKLINSYGLSAVIIYDNKTYTAVNSDNYSLELKDTEYSYVEN